MIRALTVAVPRPAPSHDGAASRYRMALLALRFAPLLVAMPVWALSLGRIDVRSLGRGGLPPALPLSWYCALAAVVVGASLTAWARRANPWLTSLYIAGTIVILYCTVPAIAAAPHYAWVYKHVGVMRFIATHGGIDPSVDIYNRWPAFFAAAAAFSNWAHIDALSYVGWAEPFFAMVDAVLLAAIGLALSGDRRVAGYSALIFTLGNWIGQNYFSPQAFAFTLTLGLLLVFVRAFSTGELRPRFGALLRRLEKVPRQTERLAPPLPWSRMASAMVALGLDAVIVAAHQLTPYVLLLELGALLVLGVTRTWWLVLAMAGVTLAYLAPNLSYVAHNFGLFTSLNPVSNLNKGDRGVAHLNFFQSNAGGMLSVTLILLMLISAWRMTRLGRGHRALTLVVLAIAPFGVLFAQDYGGEASLRVFLFSSPWRDVLISLGLLTVADHRLRQVIATAICALVTVFFVQAFYGAEELNLMPSAEVAGSEYFYAHAPAGSVLVQASPDFPGRVGARYALMRGPQAEDQPNLVSLPSFQGRPLGRAQIPIVISVIHQYARTGFVVFATTGYRFAELQEVTLPGALASLERAIATSSQFRLWYANADVRIYELSG